MKLCAPLDGQGIPGTNGKMVLVGNPSDMRNLGKWLNQAYELDKRKTQYVTLTNEVTQTNPVWLNHKNVAGIVEALEKTTTVNKSKKVRSTLAYFRAMPGAPRKID